MQKTLLYTVFTLLLVVVISLVSLVVYDTFYYTPTHTPTPSATLKAKTVKKETAPPPAKKPLEKTETLSIATEASDYIKSQTHAENIETKPLLNSSCQTTQPIRKHKKKSFSDGIPRLAIIMDDIATKKHMDAVKKIPFVITPSIFPATKKHPHTPEFARYLHNYMIHMPMEAFSFEHPEENTLLITDTLDIIEKKVAVIVNDFPDVMVINNHTGSKFTSNAEAMDRLFCVLDNYNINFVDSKTTANSKGKSTGELFNRVVLERNIFLDNEADVAYILNQLQKAVNYAKKHGEAIAICHPRAETFEAFNQAKEILTGVKMVYINELF